MDKRLELGNTLPGRDRDMNPYVRAPLGDRPEHEPRGKDDFHPSKGGIGKPVKLPLTAAAPAPGTKAEKELLDKVAPFNWSHAHMHYLPNEARQEAEERIQHAEGHAQRCEDKSVAMEKERDAMESSKKETEIECMRKVHGLQWEATRTSMEYEERIRKLEHLLESERQVHAKQLAEYAQQVISERELCESRVQATEKRCAADVAAAKMRAKEAEDLLQAAQQRCDEKIVEVKTREAACVERARKDAESRVQSIQKKYDALVEQNKKRLEERAHEMEETISQNRRVCENAKQEAMRHTHTMAKTLEDHRHMLELDLKTKEDRLEDWRETQRRQNSLLAKHCQGQIELEKGMHTKTMERTMGRVTRHLQYGDGHLTGRESPTCDLFKTHMIMSGERASPLARAGAQTLALEH